MAISEKIQGRKVYIIYGYKVNDKHKRIYCGPKGSPDTESKVLDAKKRHFNERVESMRQQMFGDAIPLKDILVTPRRRPSP